jgi:ubiquinone/menaquinone biosynthesis C-methylase UbiE
MADKLMEIYNSDLPKIEEFVDLQGKSLLEVGCGDGRLTALLAEKAQEITAIDPDVSSIESAHDNIAGVNFLVGSGENLDFPDNSFDIVLFSYSLHHQDCVQSLAEARRVVRYDGEILMLEPTPDSDFTRLVNIFEKNEIVLLQKTLDHIKSSYSAILREDTYSVSHPFADENVLYHYFMTKYSTEADDGAVEKMQAIIGNKKTNRPIIVQDRVSIFLITPY